MTKYQNFGEFWTAYRDKSVDDRAKYFASLSKEEKQQLIKSLFDDGWDNLIAQNIIDKKLDFIKEYFDIDLIDLRIKALTKGQEFVINTAIWDLIVQQVSEFSDYYDVNTVFGGLSVSTGPDKKYHIKKSRSFDV